MTQYPSETCHGVMFHHFHNGRHPTVQGSIAAEEFEEILWFIGVDRILHPITWLAKHEANSLEARDLCLTLDDSLLCQIDVALPVLERLGLKAFWFVYSSVFEGQLAKFEIYRAFRTRCFRAVDEFYERFFQAVLNSPFAPRVHEVLAESVIAARQSMFPFYSIDDIRFRLIRDIALATPEYEGVMDALMQEAGVDPSPLADGLWMSDAHLSYLSERGHVVGLHSYSHPMTLATLPRDAQREEYERNLSHLSRVCGRAPVVMAHPADSYNDDTVDILRTLGVRCGFRSTMSDATRTNGRARWFEVPRRDHATIARMLRERRSLER